MLSRPLRTALLSLHITLVALWLGALGAMLLLNVAKTWLVAAGDVRVLDAAIFVINDRLAINVAYGVILTGLAFSVLAGWGFTRHYWIIAKWLGLVLLFAWVVGWQAPVVNAVAAISDVQREAALDDPGYLALTRRVTWYSLAELGVLVTLVALSVLKPRGERQPRRILDRRLVAGLSTLALIALGLQLYNENVLLARYRQMPVCAVDLRGLDDGVYAGTARFGFDYRVEVRLRASSIETIEVAANREGWYPRLAAGVIDKILAAQRVDVDTVTGASTTSRMLILAVEDALRAARRDPDCGR